MCSAYQALSGYLMSEALFFAMALVELQVTRKIVFAKSVQFYSCFREREFADLLIPLNLTIYLILDTGIMLFLRDIKGFPLVYLWHFTKHHFLAGGHLSLR